MWQSTTLYFGHTSTSLALPTLYLERTGPTALLDIDIDLHERSSDSTEIGPDDRAKAGTIPHILDFLIAHGACVDRWRSIYIFTAQYQVLVPFINFLNMEFAPAVRSLWLDRDMFSKG